ncbi:hypothetical protein BSNK01_17280 [Bacillaceae bacterium]
MNKKKASPWKAVGLVTVISFDLAIPVVCGVWGGRWLDGRLKTDPLFLLVGLFAGLAVGVLAVSRAIRIFTGEENEDR